MACAVCFEKFKTERNFPMILECGHTICSECLNDVINKNPICPICKGSITLSLENHKKNFIVIDIICSKKAKKEAQRTAKNNVTCTNSHELSYEQQSSLIYQKIYGDPILKCSHCEVTWEGDSCHCFQCRFLLCKSCYDDQSSPKITQKTSLHVFSHPHHILYNYSNAEDYVTKKFNIYLNCSICNIRMHDKAIGCRACKFYICEECQNRNPYIKAPLCGFHDLELQQSNLNLIRNQQLICNICELSISNQCYNCPSCNYKICNDCYIYYTSQYSFDFECEKSHPMYLSYPLEYYYKFHASVMECDACKTLFYEPRTKMFHCRKCKFDICQECFWIFYKHRKNERKILCKYKHRVYIKNLKEDEGVCIECRKEIKKFLLFYCEECKEYYCPNHTFKSD